MLELSMWQVKRSTDPKGYSLSLIASILRTFLAITVSHSFCLDVVASMSFAPLITLVASLAILKHSGNDLVSCSSPIAICWSLTGANACSKSLLFSGRYDLLIILKNEEGGISAYDCERNAWCVLKSYRPTIWDLNFIVYLAVRFELLTGFYRP